MWVSKHWFAVIGILRPIPLLPGLDSAAFIGRDIAAELFDTTRSSSTVYVRTDPDQVEEVQAVLGPTANPQAPNEVDVSRPSDALAAKEAADETLTALLKLHDKRKAACTLAVTIAENPTGLGRVFLDEKNNVLAMIEHKDCTPHQRENPVVNAGCYVFDRALLEKFLKKLGSKNAQGEEYLTDALTGVLSAGGRVEALLRPEGAALLGVNTHADLAQAFAVLKRRVLQGHLERGVAIVDPESTLIEVDVSLEPGARILPFTYISRGCRVAAGAVVGPFARLRGKSALEAHAEVGNFVELKKTTLGAGAKANHLAYLGDSVIGAKTNIGAGTITCNFDGTKKHPTVIGSHAFVGSNSTLVAPITIGDGAYVAAGSVITDDVPADALGIGRGRQENKPGWAARRRASKQPTPDHS